MPDIAVHIIGYSATILLVLSFLFKDVVKLRTVNTVACVLFVIYSVIIHAYPVAIANAIIVAINLYHLFLAKKSEP